LLNSTIVGVVVAILRVDENFVVVVVVRIFDDDIVGGGIVQANDDDDNKGTTITKNVVLKTTDNGRKIMSEISLSFDCDFVVI
jgi:hypothetical protein